MYKQSEEILKSGSADDEREPLLSGQIGRAFILSFLFFLSVYLYINIVG